MVAGDRISDAGAVFLVLSGNGIISGTLELFGARLRIKYETVSVAVEVVELTDVMALAADDTGVIVSLDVVVTEEVSEDSLDVIISVKDSVADLSVVVFLVEGTMVIVTAVVLPDV